ncbi:unnamed protein product [Oikopleura dioica]|uniref:RING-type domain-containing protein n=1 Tax=Oikopleura dioica TaxID=34765 RepID=E4WT77_OIKDI|nr:unnamed protein product [Oikopleura dioica]
MPVEGNVLGFKNQTEEDFLCPLCMSIIGNPKETPCCRQIFCEYCLKKSLERTSDCPVCKAHICESRFLAPSKFFLAALNGLTISCKFEACKHPIVYEFREKHQSECVAEVKCEFCQITVMRKELENHHSECVGFLQNQIKIKDEMIKKQAQKIERMRINERIYGRGRRSLSPQVPPGEWERDQDEDSDWGDGERLIVEAQRAMMLNYNQEYNENNYPRLYGQRGVEDDLIEENLSDVMSDI